MGMQPLQTTSSVRHLTKAKASFQDQPSRRERARLSFCLQKHPKTIKSSVSNMLKLIDIDRHGGEMSQKHPKTTVSNGRRCLESFSVLKLTGVDDPRAIRLREENPATGRLRPAFSGRRRIECGPDPKDIYRLHEL